MTTTLPPFTAAPSRPDEFDIAFDGVYAGTIVLTARHGLYEFDALPANAEYGARSAFTSFVEAVAYLNETREPSDEEAWA